VDEATRQGEQAVNPREPAEIRADIEETRSEVGDTAAALAEKADVKARAEEKATEVKERAQTQASQAGEQVRRNPVPLAVAGAVLVAFVIWRRRR
jgi:Flp pilus assembly protein TadB